MNRRWSLCRKMKNYLSPSTTKTSKYRKMQLMYRLESLVRLRWKLVLIAVHQQQYVQSTLVDLQQKFVNQKLDKDLCCMQVEVQSGNLVQGGLYQFGFPSTSLRTSNLRKPKYADPYLLSHVLENLVSTLTLRRPRMIPTTCLYKIEKIL